MRPLKRTLSTLTVAALLALPAAVAQAKLSAAEISAIAGKSGIRVLTSDGAYVGTTNGLNIGQDQTRMFLRVFRGSIFRGRSDSVVVTTITDNLTLRGTDLVLADNKQRVRNKANFSTSDRTRQIEVFLLQRKRT
ncbi:hypothetical protein [Tateyamaria sp.]|uniref:hypothetical protein n=1 Tax=Tateyamaria sp. TaxID=1929288 RepID=UPI0032A06977